MPRCLNGQRLIVRDRQYAAEVHAQRPMLRVDREQFGFRPLQPVSLRAEAVAEVDTAFPDRSPFRRGEVAAGRGVRRQVVEGIPPPGDRIGEGRRRGVG